MKFPEVTVKTPEVVHGGMSLAIPEEILVKLLEEFLGAYRKESLLKFRE